MNEAGILSQLQVIFCNVLEDDQLELSIEQTIDDFEDWDSVTHVELILEIESNFKVKFSALDVIEMDNIEVIVQQISDKLGL